MLQACCVLFVCVCVLLVFVVFVCVCVACVCGLCVCVCVFLVSVVFVCVPCVCGLCVLGVCCSGASCGLVLGSAGVICWGLVLAGVDRDLHLKVNAITLAYTHGFCDYQCSLTAIPCRMHRISSDLRS